VTATIPATQKPQPIETGKIAKRYKLISPSGSTNCSSKAIRPVTTAIAAAPTTRPVAAWRAAYPRPVVPDLPVVRLPIA
jgi:hypothetical protein